jgi:hypothetical protein
VGEWFNPVAWNAAVGQLTGGSNPPLPASYLQNTEQQALLIFQNLQNLSAMTTFQKYHKKQLVILYP